jgi:hypothetical protein
MSDFTPSTPSTTSTPGELIAAEAASQGGKLLAYQVGLLYPRFRGVPREALAEVFDRHGFAKIAKRLRSITERTALAHVCGRPGDVASRGLHIVSVRQTDGDHLQAWVICKASEVGREDVEHMSGARVFSCPAGIFAAGPVVGVEDPTCKALADELAARAQLLASTCDVATVSRACGDALGEVTAYQFLSKGSYILRAGDPGAQRIAALYRDLRASFYDDVRRAGLQAGVAEIMGHAGSGNMLAVSDAIITDAERQVSELEAQLDKDRASGRRQPGLLQRHRAQAQAVLDSIRPLRELLGASAERLERLTSELVKGYGNAQHSSDLSLPDWVRDEIANIRDAGAPPPARPVGEPATSADAEPESEPAVSDAASDADDDSDDPFNM